MALLEEGVLSLGGEGCGSTLGIAPLARERLPALGLAMTMNGPGRGKRNESELA